MRLHSQTSQYGTLSRASRMLPEDTKKRLRETLKEIRLGQFTNEWSDEQARGYPNFERLRHQAETHEINRAEVLALKMLESTGLKKEP